MKKYIRIIIIACALFLVSGYWFIKKNIKTIPPEKTHQTATENEPLFFNLFN